MKVGSCKVCKGNIVTDDGLYSLGSQFYCKSCGIAYHKVPKDLCNEDGLRMGIWK